MIAIAVGAATDHQWLQGHLREPKDYFADLSIRSQFALILGHVTAFWHWHRAPKGTGITIRQKLEARVRNERYPDHTAFLTPLRLGPLEQAQRSSQCCQGCSECTWIHSKPAMSVRRHPPLELDVSLLHLRMCLGAKMAQHLTEPFRISLIVNGDKACKIIPD